MSKTTYKKSETVDLTLEWLKSLIEYAERAEASADESDLIKDIKSTSYNQFFHSDFPSLIGFINSAKGIISLRSNKPKK